jgi:hypothetical protein
VFDARGLSVYAIPRIVDIGQRVTEKNKWMKIVTRMDSLVFLTALTDYVYVVTQRRETESITSTTEEIKVVRLES